jgi:hypothetical protein
LKQVGQYGGRETEKEMSPRRKHSLAAAGQDGDIGGPAAATRNNRLHNVSGSSRTMTSTSSSSAAANAALLTAGSSCITAVESSALHFTVRIGGGRSINNSMRNKSSTTTLSLIEPNQFASMPPLPQQRRKKSKLGSPSPNKTKEGGEGGPPAPSPPSLLKRQNPNSYSNISTKASARRQQHPVELVAHRLGLMAAATATTTTTATRGDVAGMKDRRSESSLVTRALDEYRLLETRVKVGRLGKGDTCEARAACLLRRCYLHFQTTSSSAQASASSRDGMAWETLAHHVGARPATLQTLHSQITNYLVDNTTTAASKQQRHQHARQEGVGGGGSINPRHVPVGAGKSANSTTGSSDSNRPYVVAAPNGRTTRAGNVDHAHLEMADRELWAALSIRLQCPILWVQQAKALWAQLETHVQSMPNAHERRGYQYDMSRYRPAYQAACLYYILSRRSKSSSNSHSSPATKSGTNTSRKRGSKKNGDDDDGSLVTTTTTTNNSNNKSVKRSLDGPRGGGSGSREVTHKMVDFVLPNSFTYLELQQVSKQVAQFVEEIERTHSQSSESSPAGNAASSTAARAATAAKTAPTAAVKGNKGLSSASVRGRSISLVAAPSSSNFASHVAPTSAKKRGPNESAASDDRRNSRRRLSNLDAGNDKDDDASSSDREWTTSMDDPYDDFSSSSPSNSNSWVDRWLQQLWNDRVTIDRDNDDDAVERRADDVLRRYGLLTVLRHCSLNSSNWNASVSPH